MPEPGPASTGSHLSEKRRRIALPAAAALPVSGEATDWEQLVGPFYSESHVSKWLRQSTAHLHQVAASHALLRLPIGTGRSAVYPTWQFTRTGDTIPLLSDILATLSHGTSDQWTWALWLAAPDDTLANQTAWQWLAHGNDPAPVLREAARDAAQWAT